MDSIVGSCSGIAEVIQDIGKNIKDAQEQISANIKEQQQTAGEVQEIKTQEADHRASQEQKLEDLQKQITEMNEALRALIEEKTSSADSQQKEAVKDLNESLTLRLDAVDKGMLELAGRVTEIEIKSLPKYWADACMEDKKIQEELAAQKAKAEETAHQFEAQISTTAKDLQELRELTEKRLIEEAAPLKGRLDAAEEASAQLARDLTYETAKIEALVHTTREELEAAAKQLEKEAKESNQAVLDAIRSGEGARLEVLEGVVRQADYERLALADRMGKELDTLRSSIESSGEAVSEKLEAVRRKASEEVKATQAVLEEQIAAGATNWKMGLAAAAEAHGKLAGDIMTESVKLQNLIQESKSEWEAADSKLAQHSVDEANKVLDVVHAEETIRLGKLEELVQQATMRHGEQVEVFQRDFASVRESITSVDQAHEQRLTALDAAATQRQQAAAQVTEALAQEFHDYVVQQESKDTESSRLETLVRALESRVWPWRNSRRDRSQTPPRQAAPQQVDEHGSPINWHGWTKSAAYSPSTPMSRPQSANRLQKRDPREEKDTSFSVPNSSGPPSTESRGKAGAVAPVGAAHAVARANARAHTQTQNHQQR